MLNDVIGNEFGDPDGGLIDAVIANDIKGYFRYRLEHFAGLNECDIAPDIERLSAVKHSVGITLAVNTGVAEQRGERVY
jgi:hypothetical protein